MKNELIEPKHEEREKFTQDEYDEMLNESGPVEVCGMTFDPADILREMDPVAYNCGFSDMQEYEDVYICPMCGEEHEDEDAAKFCCQTEEEEEEDN